MNKLSLSESSKVIDSHETGTYRFNEIPDSIGRAEIERQYEMVARGLSMNENEYQVLLASLREKTVYAKAHQAFTELGTGMGLAIGVVSAATMPRFFGERMTRRKLLVSMAAQIAGLTGFGAFIGSQTQISSNVGRFGKFIKGPYEVRLVESDLKMMKYVPAHEGVHHIQHVLGLPTDHIPGKQEGLSTAVETFLGLQEGNEGALNFRRDTFKRDPTGFFGSLKYEGGVAIGEKAHLLATQSKTQDVGWAYLRLISRGMPLAAAEEEIKRKYPRVSPALPHSPPPSP